MTLSLLDAKGCSIERTEVTLYGGSDLEITASYMCVVPMRSSSLILIIERTCTDE